jgi:hypothetical protein
MAKKFYQIDSVFVPLAEACQKDDGDIGIYQKSFRGLIANIIKPFLLLILQQNKLECLCPWQIFRASFIIVSYTKTFLSGAPYILHSRCLLYGTILKKLSRGQTLQPILLLQQ